MTDTHNNLTLTPMQAAGAIRNASTYNGSGQYTSVQLEIAKDMAYEALEKQIPKKLIPKKLIIIGREKCCPVCKEEICSEGDDGNYGDYCFSCGQALDWSDAE